MADIILATTEDLIGALETPTETPPESPNLTATETPSNEIPENPLDVLTKSLVAPPVSPGEKRARRRARSIARIDDVKNAIAKLAAEVDEEEEPELDLTNCAWDWNKSFRSLAAAPEETVPTGGDLIEKNTVTKSRYQRRRSSSLKPSAIRRVQSVDGHSRPMSSSNSVGSMGSIGSAHNNNNNNNNNTITRYSNSPTRRRMRGRISISRDTVGSGSKELVRPNSCTATKPKRKITLSKNMIGDLFNDLARPSNKNNNMIGDLFNDLARPSNKNKAKAKMAKDMTGDLFDDGLPWPSSSSSNATKNKDTMGDLFDDRPWPSGSSSTAATKNRPKSSLSKGTMGALPNDIARSSNSSSSSTAATRNRPNRTLSPTKNKPKITLSKDMMGALSNDLARPSSSSTASIKNGPKATLSQGTMGDLSNDLARPNTSSATKNGPLRLRRSTYEKQESIRNLTGSGRNSTSDLQALQRRFRRAFPHETTVPSDEELRALYSKDRQQVTSERGDLNNNNNNNDDDDETPEDRSDEHNLANTLGNEPVSVPKPVSFTQEDLQNIANNSSDIEDDDDDDDSSGIISDSGLSFTSETEYRSWRNSLENVHQGLEMSPNEVKGGNDDKNNEDDNKNDDEKEDNNEDNHHDDEDEYTTLHEAPKVEKTKTSERNLDSLNIGKQRSGKSRSVSSMSRKSSSSRRSTARRQTYPKPVSSISTNNDSTRTRTSTTPSLSSRRRSRSSRARSSSRKRAPTPTPTPASSSERPPTSQDPVKKPSSNVRNRISLRAPSNTQTGPISPVRGQSGSSHRPTLARTSSISPVHGQRGSSHRPTLTRTGSISPVRGQSGSSHRPTLTRTGSISPVRGQSGSSHRPPFGKSHHSRTRSVSPAPNASGWSPKQSRRRLKLESKLDAMKDAKRQEQDDKSATGTIGSVVSSMSRMSRLSRMTSKSRISSAPRISTGMAETYKTRSKASTSASTSSLRDGKGTTNSSTTNMNATWNTSFKSLPEPSLSSTGHSSKANNSLASSNSVHNQSQTSFDDDGSTRAKTERRKMKARRTSVKAQRTRSKSTDRRPIKKKEDEERKLKSLPTIPMLELDDSDDQITTLRNESQKSSSSIGNGSKSHRSANNGALKEKKKQKSRRRSKLEETTKRDLQKMRIDLGIDSGSKTTERMVASASAPDIKELAREPSKSHLQHKRDPRRRTRRESMITLDSAVIKDLTTDNMGRSNNKTAKDSKPDDDDAGMPIPLSPIASSSSVDGGFELNLSDMELISPLTVAPKLRSNRKRR